MNTETLYWRLISDWRRYVDDRDIVEWLEAFDAHVREQIRRLGGRQLFEQLSDILSNVLVLADQRELSVVDFRAETDRLYLEVTERPA